MLKIIMLALIDATKKFISIDFYRRIRDNCTVDQGFPNGGSRPKGGPRRVQKGPRDYFQKQL